MPLRLSELNDTLSRHPAARFVGTVVFLAALASYLGYFAAKFGLNGPPSSTGDEPSYDSMGWELSHGRGFALDYSDPEFRAPYDKAAREVDEGRFTLPEARQGPITYRPPLYPCVIAGTNRLFGRQFWAIRVVNSAAMAAACGLLAQHLFRAAGLLPAMIGAFTFVVVDYRTRLYGRAIIAEAIACLLVALLAIALLQMVRSRKIAWTVCAGIVTGLAILARQLFVLWIPGIAVIVYLGCRGTTSKPHASPGPLMQCSVFVGVAMLVVSPWMMRNSLLLGAFMPLGTQGLTELSAGYGDAAYRHGGVWHSLSQQGFFDDVVTQQMSTIEAERATAEYSSRKAFQWIRQHPLQALALAPLKVIHEFRPDTWGQAFVSCLALIGLVFTIRTVEGRVFAGLLLANAFAVAVTWSVQGRFLVPLVFVLHAFAAIGVWSVLMMLAGRRRRSVPAS